METTPTDYPAVTEELYREAVQHLLQLAENDTDGSRIAAQVLLSAHDGQEWQVDLVEMRRLDYMYYAAVLTVIRGAVELKTGPHTVIDGGLEIFAGLAARWARLKMKNRWKPSCYRCWGQGSIPEFPDDPNNVSLIECPDCGGRGW